MAPCTHPGTSREVKEARRPHTCSRSCAFEEKETKKKRKIPPHPKHTTKSAAARRRDHLETACDETRPTRSPTLARFHRSRVCGNRHRTALEISTSREVNEARLPHTCSRPYAFEEQKNKNKMILRSTRNPAVPKHTTKSTAARRLQPPRNGVQ